MNSYKIAKNGDLVLTTTELDSGGIEWESSKYFRPYLVSDLPRNFGCIEYGTRVYTSEDELMNGEDLIEGIGEWINFRGATYIAK